MIEFRHYMHGNPHFLYRITALCVTNVLRYVSLLALSSEDVLCVAPGDLLDSNFCSSDVCDHYCLVEFWETCNVPKG